MGDPILALKWFCLFVIIGIVLNFCCKWARNYRILYGEIKFTASNTETYLTIALIADCFAAVICLLWCVIAWIIK